MSGRASRSTRHYGGLKGTPASNLSSGTATRASSRPAIPHLRADSPLRDSGIVGPAGGSGIFDLEGRFRGRQGGRCRAPTNGATRSSPTVFRRVSDGGRPAVGDAPRLLAPRPPRSGAWRPLADLRQNAGARRAALVAARRAAGGCLQDLEDARLGGIR